MAQVDGSIVIDTEIRADGFKEGTRELEASVRQMASTVKDVGTKAKTALNKQIDAFSKLNGEYAAQSKKVDELKKKVAEYGNQKIPTEEYSGLQKQLDKLSAKYDEVDAKKREWENLGFSEKDSLSMKELSTQLEDISQEMGEIIAKQEQLEASGTAFKDPLKTKEASTDVEKLETALRKLDDMRNCLNTFYSSIKGTVKDFGGSVSTTDGYMNLLQSTLNGLSMAGRGAIYILKSVSDKMINSRNGIDVLRDAFGKLDSTIKKVFSTMLKFTGRTVLAGLKKLANGIFAIHKSANKTSMSLARMLGMSILFSTVFGAISTVNNGIKEGADNLAIYSDEMNNSLSMLMSSLTQLKNSFATAFSPILTVVAPILSSFINLISRAVTYVGMFVAALTGQDSFVKAIGVQQDYRSSLSSTASSAIGAADATNELADATENAADAAERYLSPLDDINRWQNNISGGNGTGGGIGGVGSPIDTGIVLPEDMFETVPIKNSIKNLADKIKKLIKSEDWEGLGEFIADGINKGLKKVYDAISWKNVGPKITAFTTAFAETFNSLVDHLNFDLLGRTVGAGINTIVNTINQLADKINWKNLGRKIAQGFNGLFDEVNWYNLGHLLGNRIRVVWDIFNGFVKDLDYAQIGESISEGLNGIFSTISFSDMADTLATALNGAFTALEAFARDFDWNNLVDNIVGGIETFVSEFQWKDNAEKLNLFLMNLLGALKELSSEIPWEEFGQGIGEFISGIDWWGVLKGVVDIIINTLGGLFSGLDESGTAGKIASFIGKALLAIKIANITGISTLVGNIVNYLIGKFETSENIKKLSDALSGVLSKGSADASKGFDVIKEAAESAAGTSSGGGLKGFAKALAPLVGEAGLIVGVGVAATMALSGLRDFIETMQGGNGVASAFGAAMDSYFNVLTEKGWISSDTASKLFDLKESLESGDMSAEEMKEATSQLMTELSNSGVTADQARQAFDLLRGQYQMSDEMVDALTLAIDGMNTSLSNSTVTIPNTQAAFSALEESTKLLRDEFKLSSDQMTSVNTALYNTDGSAKTAQDAFNSVIDVLESMGVNTEEAAKYLSEKIPGAVRTVESSVNTHMSNAQQKIESTTKSAERTVAESTDNMASDTEDAFGDIDDTTVLKWGNSSREVQLNLRSMKLAASTELANMTKTVRSYSQSMYNIMTKKFEYLARDVGTIIGSIVSNIRDQMNSVISIVNSAISSINYSISGIESAMNFGPWEIPTAFGSRIIGFHATFPRVPRVPYLASGAVIPPNKEFMAVLGDQKQGNNIEAPENLIRRIVREETRGSGVQRIEVPVYLNRREIARATVDEGKLIRMQTGKNPFELA